MGCSGGKKRVPCEYEAKKRGGTPGLLKPIEEATRKKKSPDGGAGEKNMVFRSWKKNGVTGGREPAEKKHVFSPPEKNGLTVRGGVEGERQWFRMAWLFF